MTASESHERGTAAASPPPYPTATLNRDVRVILDPDAVLRARHVEEHYCGHGFHPPLRSLP